MKKIALFAALAALAVSVRAEDQARFSGLRNWFKHLKEGLADSSVSEHYQRKGSFAAVAAVRGAKQDSVDPKVPAFKSSESVRKSKELKAERAELSSSVDLILAGQVKEGEAGLDAFEKAHPKSPLLADARQARQKAKELETGEAPKP
jgi:hypothetical protein